MSDLLLASNLILWLLVIAMAFLLAGTLRQLGLVQLRLGADPGALITRAGLDRGELAPDFEAAATDGVAIRLSALPDVARVLVFLSTTCESCRQLVPHLAEVESTRRRHFDFLVICRGTSDACRELVRDSGLSLRVVIDPDGEVQRRYEVDVTPFAYVLDHRSRVVIRGIVNNWVQLEALLNQEGVLEPPVPRQELTAVSASSPGEGTV